jgi:hypothetical protein
MQYRRCLLPGMVCLLLVLPASADFPKPSPYPITWELKFDYETPRRLVMDVPGSTVPKAYWYLTYTVTNESDKEQVFLPLFEMLAKDGRVIRSDRHIPAAVFERIRQREGKRFMEPFTTIGGEIRIGEDEARDGVAIWEEPTSRMGTFTLFISGLSGETAIAKDGAGREIKDSDGKPMILRKTLQLDFEIPGDESHPGEALIKQTGQQWVMR